MSIRKHLLDNGFYELIESDRYLISRNGKVWDDLKERFLAVNFIAQKRYPCVRLDLGKGYKMYLLHRLLATNFLPNPNHYPIVRHLDDNSSNYDLSNLAWGTFEENSADVFRNGLRFRTEFIQRWEDIEPSELSLEERGIFMEFFQIKEVHTKKDGYIIYPSFIIGTSSDFMVRGKSFYAIWDEDSGMWTRDEFKVQSIVDKHLFEHRDNLQKKTDQNIEVWPMYDFDRKSWKSYKNYLTMSPDHFIELDRNVKFSNDKLSKEDYASFVLPYPLLNTPCPNYDKLMSVLYEPEERQKLEWAIGAIISGDSKNIQKFVVLYGDAGSGKSTFLNIVQKLFPGYCATFEARALGVASDQFGMESLKDNPLVGIQHDGDLSRIEDNTRLNSIVSHEKMVMREKFKSAYSIRLDTFLFMGTNQPVKITDSKSGIIRRLIDVSPSGQKLDPMEYRRVVEGINYELSGIAWHCLQVYKELGQDAYNGYVPLSMMYQTDHFFNFVEDCYFDFEKDDYVTLRRAWDLYKNYCDSAAIPYRWNQIKVKEELKTYFDNYYDTRRIDGSQKRKVYVGFKKSKFVSDPLKDRETAGTIDLDKLELDCTVSEVDILLANCPAQYANEQETPIMKWDNVTTTLKELDTTRLHYVRPPENHIVIDFDLKDENEEKSAKLNLEEAAKWPATYAEFSKGGAGVHLHYIYDGDPSTLSAVYSPGIEVKVFSGKSSLRRKLTFCNALPIAHLSSGLPLKEVKKVVNFDRVQSEKGLRSLIDRNLRKEIHPATKPSVDFIYKILEDAYNNGLQYDVRDMRPRILAFANNSSHQNDYCVRLVAKMKFCSEEAIEEKSESESGYSEDQPIAFYDVEVFPNLLLICWKYEGEGHEVVRMYNPSPSQVGEFMKLKLIGFNNRRYDNHIVYARYLGWSNEEIYQLSRRLIGNSQNATFREAYNISYADIYEYSSVRQSLKKFEIDLGIHHMENAYPWDEPLPEECWEEVGDYCCNDVIATEAVFHARYSDFVAQEILAELTGLPVNSNGNTLAARLIFGNNRKPKLVYTDLATGEASDPAYQNDSVINAFPGYEFKKYDEKLKKPVNMYRGTDVGFGGYVYAEPGMYTDVALIDVASMHPHSAIAMNYFGEYTKTFQDLVQARIYIKHKDYDAVRGLFGGRLNKYLEDESKIGDLAYSLKIVINKVYGLTSASFDNEFHDSRNTNNIVALRGALFMRTLQDEVAKRGFKFIHVKTDSAKIPNATPEIIQFCFEFAKQYGYTFEHEATYDRMCLVNNSVYIAKYMSAERCQDLYGYVPDKNKKKAGKWTPTGAQFAHPFVFKTLFSREKIEFKDLCETKSVKSMMYLDFNEDLPDVSEYELERASRWKEEDGASDKKHKHPYPDLDDISLKNEIEKGHNYKFVGRIGLFVPVVPGAGGAELLALRDDKYSSVTGAKNYRWLEAEAVQSSGLVDKIDMRYYRGLVDDAIANISQYGDFEWFANNDDPPSEANHPLDDPNDVPWLMPCHDPSKKVCEDCPEYETCEYLKKGVR